jgi:hypothetical protein
VLFLDKLQYTSFDVFWSDWQQLAIDIVLTKAAFIKKVINKLSKMAIIRNCHNVSYFKLRLFKYTFKVKYCGVYSGIILRY